MHRFWLWPAGVYFCQICTRGGGIHSFPATTLLQWVHWILIDVCLGLESVLIPAEGFSYHVRVPNRWSVFFGSRRFSKRKYRSKRYFYAPKRKKSTARSSPVQTHVKGTRRRGLDAVGLRHVHNVHHMNANNALQEVVEIVHFVNKKSWTSDLWGKHALRNRSLRK